MKIVLAYKNFAANKNISHIGLGVAAMNTSKVLRHAGFETYVAPVVSPADLMDYLTKNPANHVIISAPWIPSNELSRMSRDFPNVHFTVNCHSNVGFLQADSNGTKILRETMELELGSHNVHLAGNSKRFRDWASYTFSAPCAFLPNLYYVPADHVVNPKIFNGGTLRIGIFGATRPLKNMMSAVGAAIEIGKNIRVPVEIWVSQGRAEGGGDTVLRSIRELVCGLPNVKLESSGWQSWPKFRQVVGHMDLLLQPSYTESFNMVTADGIAENVVSVVSPAITWAPGYWKADVDDTLHIAQIGRRHLGDKNAIVDGVNSLRGYVANGLNEYRDFFKKVTV